MSEQHPIPTRSNFQNYMGHRFGRWLVVGYLGKIHRQMWLCRCDCGNEKGVRIDGLLNGRSKSCGCFSAERRKFCARTHGKTLHPAWRVWRGMLRRCLKAGSQAYANYGGRGISVCQRWKDSFEDFCVDMGEVPKGGSLDRINNAGNYEPGNCKWSTRSEQCRNRRSNNMITIDGVTRCLVEWAAISGVARDTITFRLKSGWSADKLLGPVRSLRPSTSQRLAQRIPEHHANGNTDDKLDQEFAEKMTGKNTANHRKNCVELR